MTMILVTTKGTASNRAGTHKFVQSLHLKDAIWRFVDSNNGLWEYSAFTRLGVYPDHYSLVSAAARHGSCTSIFNLSTQDDDF